MTIELNTNLVPMFHGTYETLWEITETNDQNGGDRSEQAIGALIRYLATDEVLREIDSMVWENWQGNGYESTNYSVKCWKHDRELEYDSSVGDFPCSECAQEQQASL